ncbi:MAG: YHS domain-containing (seleno)protein [Kiloniellales bacterium]|nr:YHS domain-containing (seleno)protein [Kiloniellales bacterium]
MRALAWLFGLGVGTVLMAASMAYGPHAWAAETAINVNGEGVAIDGYDTVSYFTPVGARRGKAEFQAEWAGALWYFATAENLAAFESDPERYAPQFGGWCAFALSTGHYASDVDPREAFTLRGDKLYLNWSRRVKHRWLRAVEDNIATAESNWPVVRQQLLDDEAAISRKWF